MKTKYVIFQDDEAIVIVTNRADAEEFVLSMCEEQAYENYIYELMADGDYLTHEEYVEQTIAERDSYRWNTCKTFYGYVLDCAADYYIACMIPELD